MRASRIDAGVVLLLAAPLLQIFASAEAASKEELTNEALKFNKDGTFHISIFGDLHFGESQYSLSLKFLTVRPGGCDMRLTAKKKQTHGINGALSKIYTRSRSSKKSSTRTDQTWSF